MGCTIKEAPAPASEAQIYGAEQALGIAFPPDYRAFLARFNGGRPEPDGFKIQWLPAQACGEDWRASGVSWFYGVRDEHTGSLVRLNKSTFEGRLPAGTLTVASDAGGNQILLALSGINAGKVLFWVKDHEVEDGDTPGYDNVGVIADNFTDFLLHRLY